MRTKTLASIAGIIWLIAGGNVCRIGVVSWTTVGTTSPTYTKNDYQNTHHEQHAY